MKKKNKLKRMLGIIMACLMILGEPIGILASEEVFVQEETVQDFDLSDGADSFEEEWKDTGESDIFESEPQVSDSASAEEEENIFGDGNGGLESDAEEKWSFLQDLSEIPVVYTLGSETEALFVETVEENVQYQWMRSSDNVNFQIIEGETKNSFKPSADALGTVWYRVKAVDANGMELGESVSAEIVTVEAEPMEDTSHLANEEEAELFSDSAAETGLSASEEKEQVPTVSKEQIVITDITGNTTCELQDTGLTAINRNSDFAKYPETINLYKIQVEKDHDIQLNTPEIEGCAIRDILYNKNPSNLPRKIYASSLLLSYVISDGDANGQKKVTEYFGEAISDAVDLLHPICYLELTTTSGQGIGCGIIIEIVPQSTTEEEQAKAPEITKDMTADREVVYTLPETGEPGFAVNVNNRNAVDGAYLGTLSYQWYQNTNKSYEGAVPVDMGKGSLETTGPWSKELQVRWHPNETAMTGKTYFFCEFTNTLGNGSKATVRSGIGSLEIKAPETPSFGVIVDEEPVGNVNVKIEDTVPKRDDLVDGMNKPIEDPGPLGVILETQYDGICLYPSDTMMTVIARACILNDVPTDITESSMGNYIASIKGRAEFDRGRGSGWMGSLNGWYTNMGFDNYTVQNGKLQPDDYISLKYTTDLGKDIGASFDEKDSKLLKNLKIHPYRRTYIDKKIDYLEGQFSSEQHDYQISYAQTSNVDGIAIKPLAENQKNQIKVYADGKEYRGYYKIPINKRKTNIRIEIHTPGSSGTDENPEVYNIAVISGQSLLKDGDIKVQESSEDGNYTRDTTIKYKEFDSSSSNAYTFSGALQDETTKPGYNTVNLTVSIPTLPKGINAYLKKGNENYPFGEDNTAHVPGGAGNVGTTRYGIYLDTGEKTEVYYLNLTKESPLLKKFSYFPMFGTAGADPAETINGQIEGTLFQVNADGKETGELGFNQQITEYNVYVGSSIDGINFDKNSVDWGRTERHTFYGHKGKISVDGEVIANNGSYSSGWSSLFSSLKEKLPIQLKDGKTDIELTLYSGEHVYRTYKFHFHKRAITSAELEAMIQKLPKTEDLSYTRDKGTVDSLKKMYDRMPESEKNQVSPEAVKKLNDAVAKIQELYNSGIAQIQELVDLINTYSGKVTEENYREYEEAVVKSQELYNRLTDWIYEKFTADHRGEYNAMQKALTAVERGRILAGKTDGISTDYIDDFMVCANAFNLTLGAEEKAYPVNFRDYVASKGSGEACLPYNAPGRLKFEIQNPEIFEIKSEIGEYVDQGLGGGGKYEDELYYMIPKKEGTTVFTVTLTDKAGKFYGQTPVMIVHVNSETEAQIKDLDKKLTDIYERPYTRKYDTWHYLEGTEGAPFTFKVNGTEAEVSVLNYNTGEKVKYPVASDGSVTVLLKDGYNPIEVSAKYEGQNVTQVYGMRGKAISYTIVNETHPGKEIQTGDKVTVKIKGLNTPVRKILRIYNPSATQFWYDTDMPYQSQLISGGGQYSAGTLTFTATGSGDMHLTNGRVFQRWWGSPLYSESTQGNTGGIAPQANNFFSRLPDITIHVSENPDYVISPSIKTVLTEGNVVKPGQTVTMKLEGLNTEDITFTYPIETSSTTMKLQSAQSQYMTTIPGLSMIQSDIYKNQSDGGSLDKIKTITFTVPEGTKDGKYKIKGGFVEIYHGDPSYGTTRKSLFQMDMQDIELIVEKEHNYQWTVTRKPSCMSAGSRKGVCDLCGHSIIESIPAVGHKLGNWTITSKATVFKSAVQTRICHSCGKKETRSYGKKLTPTGKVNARTVVLKIRQSTTKLKVTGLAYGDSIKSWRSSNTRIVKVNSKGKITAMKKPGKAKITITLASGKKLSVNVKVQKTTVRTSRIGGLKSKVTLSKGKKLTLRPVLTPITSQEKIKYTSSNKKVATVSNKGVVIARGRGKAKITVISGKKKYTVTVTVPTTRTTAIKNLKKEYTVKRGKTLTLKPKRNPSNSDEKFTYSSSNKKIITVSSKGVIKGLRKGTAYVTVKSGKIKQKIKITVK